MYIFQTNRVQYVLYNMKYTQADWVHKLVDELRIYRYVCIISKGLWQVTYICSLTCIYAIFFRYRYLWKRNAVEQKRPIYVCMKPRSLWSFRWNKDLYVCTTSDSYFQKIHIVQIKALYLSLQVMFKVLLSSYRFT